MSYSNNPRSILAGAGILVTPSTGTGADAVTVAVAGTQVVAVRIATATPVSVASTDNLISIQVPGPVAVAVQLAASPATGDTITVKDGLGLASIATPITITPNTGTIDGAVNATINASYGSLTMVYDGTQWLIV